MKSFLRLFIVYLLSQNVSPLMLAQASSTPPLGLFRLRNAATASVPSIVNTNKFAVDDLTPGNSGGSKGQERGVDCLKLSAQHVWSRPLRGSGSQVLFVSFSGYVSISTVIRAGGAWLGVIEGPNIGYAQLMIGGPGSGGIAWQPTGVNFKLEGYAGKTLASLSTITVRLNPAASSWDLFFGARLVADNLPFYVAAGQTNSPDFVVTAGAGGAWIDGLAMSDENPLYVDANANGIADSFELQQNGALLAANAPTTAHHALAQMWRSYQSAHATPSLVAKRILPDRFSTSP